MPISKLATLPEEILLKIFRNLPVKALTKMAQVSKNFRRVSYDHSLWEHVVLRGQKLRAGTLGFVLSRGTAKLHVFNCQFEEPCSFEEPPEHGYDLQYLHVKDYTCKHSDEIQFIISHCRRLKDIALEVPLLAILDCHCQAIAANSQLECFYLGGTGLTFTALLSIIRGCRRLRTLLYGTHIRMTPSELQTLVDELSHHTQVIDVFKYNASLRDEHVSTLVKNCPNMTDLNFKGCNGITEPTMHHLKRLNKLENLDISECSSLPYSAIGHLPSIMRFKTLSYTFDMNS